MAAPENCSLDCNIALVARSHWMGIDVCSVRRSRSSGWMDTNVSLARIRAATPVPLLIRLGLNTGLAHILANGRDIIKPNTTT